VILVDTSVWVDHLRGTDEQLVSLLSSGTVLTHPLVIGELALGSLHRRDVVLGALRNLPRAVVADDDEVLRFIEAEALAGIGIGYIDAHLLAATRLTPDASFWTRDRRLSLVAGRLSLSARLGA
jgi:hypothetical protein